MAKKRYLLKPKNLKKPSINYQAALNQEQQRVVFESDGPCLVLAGPGSGKTRTLIYRLAYLLERGVKPENILLVTFTRKAAEEMINRLTRLLGYQPKGLLAGTFHHVGNVILRKYISLLGWPENFTILDQEDARELLKNLIEDYDLKPRAEFFPKEKVIQTIISLSRNTLLSIGEVVSAYADFHHLEPYVLHLEKIFRLYQRRKKISQVMDYDDLLAYWLTLMRKVPAVKKALNQKFQYILVDEFQDTNRLQGQILFELSNKQKDILVVADDAQSIYSFRGADIENIFQFVENFPQAKKFTIETNYRSSPEILSLANAVIQKNIHQFPKTLRAVRGCGKKPILVPLINENTEAEFIAQRIIEINQEGIPLSEIAVLFRSHWLSARLELELLERNIPYIVRGGLRFFEQAHIKDVLAFLKILNNHQNELAWQRVLKTQEGIGRVYAKAIFDQIKKQKSLEKALTSELFLSTTAPFKGKVLRGWEKIRDLLLTLWQENQKASPIEEIIETITQSWYAKFLQATYENAQERLEDIKQLSIIASEFKNISQFLDQVILSEVFHAREVDPKKKDLDFLTLSTIHQAKGLEWQVVFIIGLINGHFPHRSALNNHQQGINKHLEEERRIFYVALTRAKDEVYLTFPAISGALVNQKSIFLEELADKLYEEWVIKTELDDDNDDSFLIYD